jgi:hypothetical protein
MAIKALVEKQPIEPIKFLQECRYCHSILEYDPTDTDNDPYWEKYIKCPVCGGFLPIVDNPSRTIEVDLDKQCGFYYPTSVLIPEGVKLYRVKIVGTTIELTEVDSRINPIESSLLVIGSGKQSFRTVNTNNLARMNTDAQPVYADRQYSGFTTIDKDMNLVYHESYELVKSTSVIIPGKFEKVTIKKA